MKTTDNKIDSGGRTCKPDSPARSFLSVSYAESTCNVCHLRQRCHGWQLSLHVFYTFFLCLLLLCGTTHAQERKELPDAPTPKINRRIFIAGVSLLAASKSADVWSTKSLLDRGGWENNPVLGQHPSTGLLTGHAAAMFAGQSAVFYLTERNRHAWVRWAGRAYIGLAIEEHARLAACNSGINTRSPRAQNCRSLFPF